MYVFEIKLQTVHILLKQVFVYQYNVPLPSAHSQLLHIVCRLLTMLKYGPGYIAGELFFYCVQGLVFHPGRLLNSINYLADTDLKSNVLVLTKSGQFAIWAGRPRLIWHVCLWMWGWCETCCSLGLGSQFPGVVELLGPSIFGRAAPEGPLETSQAQGVQAHSGSVHAASVFVTADNFAYKWLEYWENAQIQLYRQDSWWGVRWSFRLCKQEYWISSKV